MPTPSEQKALAFLAFIILLGGAVRIVRAGAPRPPSDEEERALAAQVQAVDNAGTRSGRGSDRRGAGGVSSGARDDGAKGRRVKAGAWGRGSRGDRASRGAAEDTSRAGWVNGYPPPSPRIDGANQQNHFEQGKWVPPNRLRRGVARGSSDSGRVIDLDVASAQEIDALPGVGPAIAQRIVANRDSLGAFGSLDGLGRVRGIGAATLGRLSGRVSFSGRAASLSAGSRGH